MIQNTNMMVLASSNHGKIVEMSNALTPIGITLKPQSDFEIETPEETGLSFIENAILKARYACQQTGLPSLADDSGLEVDALGGEPGIYSARYAGEHVDFKASIDKVLSKLRKTSTSSRRARFVSVLALVRWPLDPCPMIAQGFWMGEITEAPSGEKGFGYDPIFYDPIIGLTAAEMDPELKTQISHRAKAIKQLSKQLLQ